MKRIRTKRLLNAMNNYFFTKENQGGLFRSTQQKETITNEVINAGHAPAEGYRVAIVPGLICLTRGKKTTYISKQDQYYYKR